MRSMLSATKLRRAASFAFWLSVGAASLRFVACLINPVPPDPHDMLDGDPPGDPPADASDAAEDPG